MSVLQNIDNRVYLEYSTDHGIHWDLVIDPCLPPAPCEAVHQGTIYDWSQYREWNRVTIPLPVVTWLVSAGLKKFVTITKLIQ